MASEVGVKAGVRFRKSGDGGRAVQAKANARSLNKLPAKAVQTITAVGKHADGGGLYLVVTPSGSKNWSFRFTRDGKSREAGLGSARDVPLVDARARAAEFRAILAKGQDPLEAKARASAPLFAEMADQFIKDQASHWRDPKAVGNWTNSLRDHATSLLPKPVNEITTEDVLQQLRPIWQAKPEIAGKVRGRIERIIDAAIALGHVKDNPARWKGGLAALLPPRKKLTKGHHAAMPYDDVPAFMVALRERDAEAARLLEFLILTGVRSGEARGVMWDEISVVNRLWTIPAVRMKAGKEHRVPLTERAIEIIQAQQRAHNESRKNSDLIFPNRFGRMPSVNVFAALFRRIGIAGITVHGFRSSFRDWAGNETSHPREVIEAALAHAVGDATERAYRRSDALERRRKLMEEWEGFLLNEK